MDETYLQPLVRLFRENSGRAWKDSDRQLTLLIDLKTPVNLTLERQVSKLQLYPEVFDPSAKPVRFWGAPDGVTAWKTFHQLGVDFINTDRPEACAGFFRDFHE